MIYGNLIYLLVVMALLATSTPPDTPLLPGYQFLAVFAAKLWVYRWIVRFYRDRRRISRVADYFSSERNLAVLALVLFGIDVYLLDLGFYLDRLPLSKQLPSLVDMAGIAVFLLYLTVLWLQLKPSYEEVVGVGKKSLVHIMDKLRLCIALVLPWLVINFLHDLLVMIPSAEFQDFMASPWGEPLFLLVMISAAVIWFPALLVRLFGCTAIPGGKLRRHIEAFCNRQEISFGGICLWPIVEGKVLTAGVVGFLGRYRYLMITPALLQSLSEEELEAVVAHEIGHVKKHHLVLYILLFLGFAVMIQLCMEPLISLLLTSSLFYEFFLDYQGDPATLLAIMTSGPLVIATLLYFRYVFGFFMRNFERQADHYSFRVMGGAIPLISVFKKISLMSGKDRDVPCWHHFSIGQRIDDLLNCQRNAQVPKRHNLKVYGILAGYFVVIAVALFLTLQAGDRLTSPSGQVVAEKVILEKIESDPGNPLWHQFHGDLLASRKQYAEAIAAFERSLELYPDNAEALNNLAWLLLTVEDNKKLYDPPRALELAKRAAEIAARSHILDTLAEAYWKNGMVDLAYETGRRALESSTGNRDYYRRQLQKFEKRDQS